MFNKVTIFIVAIAAVSAQEQHSHSYSSKSVVHHEITHPQTHHKSQSSHTPVAVHHAAPIAVHHAAPAAVHHVAPVQVHQAPVAVHHAPVHKEEHHDYYAYPKYVFEYKVEDPHTGDNKYQHESRDGDVVKGVYSLHDADGSIRTVEYNSDKHTGFNAFVKHSEPTKHVQPVHHH
ncbi:cuticle protein 8-like [Galleria mellonella]|uniref:Cuticle protein 8-like n=1 Tax=Galleria mellonella TaxID=7137 RepID=A0A6J1WKJ9_GALME|nr:cuticle protein 8-like [Galleria mellonella]